MRIGSYQAKTHLPELLSRVRQGERFTITLRGTDVAELIPVQSKHVGAVEAVQFFRKLRSHSKTGKESLQDLIREGRR